MSVASPSPISTTLAGIPLAAPILLAAGASGTLDEMADVLDLSRVGGVISKSITRLNRDGNPTWRILPSRSGLGMLNAIGLANPGIDGFLTDYLPRSAAMPCAVICSVAGFSVDDYVIVAEKLDAWRNPPAATNTSSRTRIDAIELNVSCPNVKAGCDFGSSPAALSELISAVRPAVKSAKLIIKLSPWPVGLPDLARAAIDSGADALTISNTMPAMEIDVHTRAPRLAHRTGGLSGPSIHPIAVKLVHDVYAKVCRDANIPIIGAGGVSTWEDAAEFILAGATCVQIGTALFADPRVPLKIAKGLDRWVREQRVSSIAELVGAVKP